ncbi:MAG: transcription termination factor Rho [Eggerthellaceae bacterium]|jgi:transcription termination factor Rho|nr:transcription termination factor Rho [Eggerthellaceae bacterium]
MIDQETPHPGQGTQVSKRRMSRAADAAGSETERKTTATRKKTVRAKRSTTSKTATAKKSTTASSKKATKQTEKSEPRQKKTESTHTTVSTSDHKDTPAPKRRPSTHTHAGTAEHDDSTRSGAHKRQSSDNFHVENKRQNDNHSQHNRSHTQNNNNNKQHNNNHRRTRRQHVQNGGYAPVVPQTKAEDLAKLKVAELRAKADELGVEYKGLKKAELVQAVLEACVRKEGFIHVEGILDILSDGYGFLRTEGYLPSEHDVYVSLSMIRRNGLRKGDQVGGQVRPARDNEKYAALHRLDTLNGAPFDGQKKRPRFANLTPVYPDERLIMEHGHNSITSRVIDLAAPIGKGQRGLIVSPPKAGKTTVLKDIAASVSANNPEVHLMCLLIDERPEEVTDMERSIKGEVVSSTFDMPCENHIAVAEMVVERAKRLVECGQDVVILLDSITRLARAYNLAQPASGRILSGGVDSTALYPPKRFLGAARNIEHGGSLTILASALIDTGSKMDEVIFEEFKGTGNMELKLDRNLADRRIFPAIDPVSSGTRKEDLLLDPQEAPLIWAVRRILANLNNTERAMSMLIKSLKQTDTNQEFLLRTAKKAQNRRIDERFEL